MATEAEITAALDKIDAATTKIGQNLAAASGVIGSIGTEVAALVAAMKNAGVSQALLDQAIMIGDHAQLASDALEAQVPVLQAIAAKGALNPVPIQPPVPIA
jgi:hypothetical protein